MRVLLSLIAVMAGTLGLANSTPYSVYPDDVLLEDGIDTFELFPLDGGAYFYMNSVLGEVTGAEVLREYQEGTLLADWEEAGEINWTKYFDMDLHPSMRKPLEKHVWLQRLYYLLPMAVEYHRTGDSAWLEAWVENLKRWAMANPPPKRPWSFERGNYVWFDMQVTWRYLVMAHSWPLIEEALDQETRQFLLSQLALHAEYIQAEVRHELVEKDPVGNHFLQKGYALLFAALYETDPSARAEYLSLANRIYERHYQTEILQDGGSVEGSPSYSHFIARMYLDVALLLQQADIPPFPYLHEAIDRQYSFLAKTISPKGRSLIIGDSYSFYADKDIRFVEHLLGKVFERGVRESTVFTPTNLAILKNERITVFINGMPPGRFSHNHAGAPSLLVYHCGEPIIWEAGMSNYDDEVSRTWHRSAAAHSSIIITPMDGNEFDWSMMRRTPPKIDIVSFDLEENSVFYKYTFKNDSLNIEWHRQVTLDDNALVVEDDVLSNKKISVDQVFNLSSSNYYIDDDNLILHAATERSLLLFPFHAEQPFAVSHVPLKDFSNRYFAGTSVRKNASGRIVSHKSELQLFDILSIKEDRYRNGLVAGSCQ